MAQQKIPTQPSVRTTAYNNLLGVDYQSDSTEISRRRSPDMVNMISDLGGIPIKRYGYHYIGADYDAFIEMDGVVYGISAGATWTTLYTVTFNANGRVSGTQKLRTKFPHNGEFIEAFAAQGRVYVFYEDGWVSFDPDSTQSGDKIKGETTVGTSVMSGTETMYDITVMYAKYPDDDSIIPTVYTMMKPNGSEMVALPAGTDITGATRGVNILTPYRRIEYCVTTDTADETFFRFPVGQIAGARAKVEILDSRTFEWVAAPNTAHASTIPSSTVPSISSAYDPAHTTDRPFEYVEYVIFDTPPFINSTSGGVTRLHFRTAGGADSGIEVPAGVPNIRVTYAAYDPTVVGGIDEKIIKGLYNERRNSLLSSKARAMYDGRLFVAVGSRVYYSRVNELFCMDDNYYIEVDSNVKALVKTSGGLSIIGEGNHPIYVATGEYSDSYDMPVYTVKASNANISLATSNCHDTLNDEPMLITWDGIYGLTTNYYSEKYSIMRSGKINRRLCADLKAAVANEANEIAVAIAHENYLWVAVNQHMYVLDGRHKDASRNGDNSYECYYFDNMPEIEKMWVVGGRMYFSDGTETYTWNDNLPDSVKYVDYPTWDGTNSKWNNGTPVKAKWTSPLDDDNAPQYYKTIQKKGTMVTISPPMQTSCQITLVRDGQDEIYVGRFNGSTFALTDAVLDAFTKKKVKKYKRLQFVVENNEPEPFGIISIVKSFVLNNYAKR